MDGMELLTPEAAAKIIGVSRTIVMRRIHSGRIASVRIETDGGRENYAVPKAAALAELARRQAIAAAG